MTEQVLLGFTWGLIFVLFCETGSLYVALCILKLSMYSGTLSLQLTEIYLPLPPRVWN